MRAVLIIAAGALVVGLSIYSLLDIARTERDRVRAVPKALWFLIALILPVIGPVLWLVFGRPRAPRRTVQAPGLPPAPHAPDDDEAYLRFLGQQSRRRQEDARREAERRRRENDEGPRDREDPGAQDEGSKDS